MKHLIQQIILVIFYLVFIDFAQACTIYKLGFYGYCYNLLVEEDGIYLQKTVKAEDKISYVSQSKVRLKNIIDKDARIISEDDIQILALFNENYYLIPKYSDEVKDYEIAPLFNKNEVSKIVSNKFFLVSGHWYYGSYTSKGKSNKHKLPELKGNLEIMADFIGRVLLKDDNAVYVFDDYSYKLEKIPYLTPSQTHLFQSLYLNRDYYLYDDDTFYLFKSPDIDFKYTDITKEFNLQGKYNGFTKADIHTSKSGDSLDTKDGLIWIKIDDSFKPVKATYLNAYKDLYVYHDKVYANNDDLYRFTRHEADPLDPSYGGNTYKDKSIDLSNVKNPKELHQPLYSVFSDNQQQYSLEKDTLRLEKKDLSAILRIFTPQSERYIEIKKKKIFVYGQQLNTNKFQNTPIFLGSIVNNEDNKNNSKKNYYDYVFTGDDYYYFFTDGKKVYAYINPGENQKPKVLDNVSPQNLKVNDYDTLQKLLNMLKTTAKEND